jgi:predicted nucleotidyltransferase
MQRTSSISAEVRFLDRDAVLADLRRVVAEAKALYPEIVKVYLFGSLVDGSWTADSDADLMIVVRAQFKEFGDSCRYQIYADSIPVDSLVYSESDFTRLAGDPESFVARNLVGAIKL